MGNGRIEMAGLRFGRLLAVEEAGHVGDRRLAWRCRCDCGNEAVVSGKNLRKGLTRSCGCLHREAIGKASITHGHSKGHLKSKTYASWHAMKNRCLNPRQKSYARYGAIGIKICPAWVDSFTAFLTEMGERPPGTTLDRINPFGNYELGNCRWSPHSVQTMNTRGRAAIRILEEAGRIPGYTRID